MPGECNLYCCDCVEGKLEGLGLAANTIARVLLEMNYSFAEHQGIQSTPEWLVFHRRTEGGSVAKKRGTSLGSLYIKSACFQRGNLKAI